MALQLERGGGCEGVSAESGAEADVRGLVPRRERFDLVRGAGLLPAKLVAGEGQHLEVGMPLVERLELLVVFGGEASVRGHVH